MQSPAKKNLKAKPTLAKPFLKWAGGKRSIIKELEKRLPRNYSGYFEAFVGGGALFFHTQPKTAYLSDFNLHLVITYNCIKDSVEELITLLKAHQTEHSKEYYLKCRASLNKETDPLKVASYFIYLNKTCFNGLYRVNKSNDFNVPMGSYVNPLICDETNLRACSNILQNIQILQHSFEQTKILEGAFYYLDPPYHETYSGYGIGGFDDEAHKKLAEYCKLIHTNGGFFMLSNSNTELIQKLYKDYDIDEVAATRSISCKGSTRGKETEVIIRNYK